MGSILTNTGAMVALQTMRQINRGMETVQGQIATGLKVGSAKDNAATWAISKVMESDVAGFKAIKESLALGSSTVNVARNAAETTTKLLTEIKEKVVLAQEENVDRGKIQADIEQLRGQIASVVGAAQFNGLNLVDGVRTETVLSSLDRSGPDVTPSRINVLAQDLRQTAQVFGSGDERVSDADAGTTQMVTLEAGADLDEADDTTAGVDITIDDMDGTNGAGTTGLRFVAGDRVVDIRVTTEDGEAGADVAARIAGEIAANQELKDLGIRVTANGADLEVRLGGEARLSGVDIIGIGTAEGGAENVDEEVDADFLSLTLNSGSIEAGDSLELDLDGTTFQFVADDRTSFSDILDNFATQINANSEFVARRVGDEVQIVRKSTGGIDDTETEAATDGVAGGKLNDLSTLNVADFSALRGGPNGATAFSDLSELEQKDAIRESLANSLAVIERLTQTVIDAAAEFGQVQKRLEIQEDFVSNLMDTLRTGIGSLVDADMEEASARLQALQVQQQLGIQSLSIANQQPQNILALFR